MKLISNYLVSIGILLVTTYCSLLESEENKKPRVSIITSVFNGDEFIEGFLADITRQTIFHECELIMINASSPGNEESIIKEYMQQYPNIIYERLDHDPGLYAVWNLAIKMASADFITNANLDDRRNPQSLEIHAQALEQYQDVDLVYSDYYMTYFPNETFECNNYRYIVQAPEFSPKLMYLCLPGTQPMWRKSMHDKYGFFNEEFISAGDLEMWNRAVNQGARFKKIPGISGLYYWNPKGLSTDEDYGKAQKRNQENDSIVRAYSYLWNWP